MLCDAEASLPGEVRQGDPHGREDQMGHSFHNHHNNYCITPIVISIGTIFHLSLWSQSMGTLTRLLYVFDIQAFG